MTPREFLAIAALVSTDFDERMRGLAEMEATDPLISPEASAWWTERADEHNQRIGAKRALWLEAAPCGWQLAVPKPGCEEQARHRIDPEDWDPCCAPAERELAAVLGDQPC